MAHWKQRSEEKWTSFRFNQPYARGLRRLKEEVLAKTDFDPTVLWQWGTMQAMALIEVLKACEASFGEDGQKLVCNALYRTGLDVGHQVLDGVEKPDDLSAVEFISFYATVINRILYASLEDPVIEDETRASFHILWCPHQDYYGAFDCRVQRYFVQGMIDAAKEYWASADAEEDLDFNVRFDRTMPAGAETCHFTIWRASDDDKEQWERVTRAIETRALEMSKEASSSGARAARRSTHRRA